MSGCKAYKIVIAIFFCMIYLGVSSVCKADKGLTTKDAFSLREGLKEANNSNFTSTLSWISKTKNPLAQKLLTWAYLINADPNSNLETLLNFIVTNPDWPNQISLQRFAEVSMKRNTPDNLVESFFRVRPPLTPYGKTRLGQMFFNKGQIEKGISIIRDAWVNGNFYKSREKTFYKRYRKYLKIKDHYRRLDRLQWEGKYWPSRRMLWKIPNDYRALGIARMFLRHNLGNVDNAIAKIPVSLKNDIGLKYERLRWRLQEGKYISALKILNDPIDDLVQPELWWRKRELVIRYLLHKGDAKKAYHLARDHKINANESKHLIAYSEAEWLAGWIALRFLANAEVAEVHFKNFYKVVKFPISRSRGAYWVARAIESLNSSKKGLASAEIWYRLGALHSTTYYGQLSLARLQSKTGIELAPQPKPTNHEIKVFNTHELTRAMRMLVDANQSDMLRPFAMALDKVSNKSWWRYLTIKLLQTSGRNDLSLKIAKLEGRENWKFTEAAFPQITPFPNVQSIKNIKVPETPLILAIIRQESAFYVKARSQANAQGLMQLMPYTAQQVAKNLRIPYSRRRLINDSVYNLTLGQAYLSNLLRNFKGSYILALSAYNAGPKRSKQWIKRFGDPRDSKVNSIDWVESIPFPETRNYVQRVLENLQVYRSLQGKNSVFLNLNDDLH